MSKKKIVEWLLDHGFATAYLVLVTASLAIVGFIAMVIIGLIVWWDRVH